MIRLKDDAPWQQVTLLDNFIIQKCKWVEYSNSNYLKPVIQWIESDGQVKPPELEEYSKTKLAKMATDKGINVEGLSKTQIIEALKCI